MRIKGRYWLKDEEGPYFETFDVEPGQETWIPAEAEHLELLTGLSDKNGREIYESDLVRVDHQDKRYTPYYAVVKWDEKDACFDFGGGVASEVSWSHEVIGNLWESPELLESNNE